MCGEVVKRYEKEFDEWANWTNKVHFNGKQMLYIISP